MQGDGTCVVHCCSAMAGLILSKDFNFRRNERKALLPLSDIIEAQELKSLSGNWQYL